MKDWANKPSAVLKTGSSPVVSASGATLANDSPIVKTGGTSSSSLAPLEKTGITEGTVARIKTTGTHLSRTVLVSPVAGGIAAGVIGVGVYGVGNLVGYLKGKKAGKDALADTAKNAGGLGISAGIGIAAANAVIGTGLVVLGVPALLPIATGVAVTCAAKKVWNRVTNRKKKT